MDKGFQDAYMNAFPASGLKSREGQHLEIYGAEYDPDSPIAKFRILIPVI
jgi:predicted transcriptional regulator YdeE